MGGEYLVQAVNDFVQLIGVKPRDVFVRVLPTNHSTQVGGELGRLVQNQLA